MGQSSHSPIASPITHLASEAVLAQVQAERGYDVRLAFGRQHQSNLVGSGGDSVELGQNVVDAGPSAGRRTRSLAMLAQAEPNTLPRRLCRHTHPAAMFRQALSTLPPVRGGWPPPPRFGGDAEGLREPTRAA